MSVIESELDAKVNEKIVRTGNIQIDRFLGHFQQASLICKYSHATSSGLPMKLHIRNNLDLNTLYITSCIKMHINSWNFSTKLDGKTFLTTINRGVKINETQLGSPLTRECLKLSRLWTESKDQSNFDKRKYHKNWVLIEYYFFIKYAIGYKIIVTIWRFMDSK